METQVTLTRNMRNIFGVVTSGAYVCDIMQHTSVHSIMWIRAEWRHQAPLKRVDVVFRGVYYFEGPTQWLGANFATASQEECVIILNKLGWLDNIPDTNRQSFIDGFSLIKVGSPPFLAKILVRSAYLSDGAPAEFQAKP